MEPEPIKEEVDEVEGAAKEDSMITTDPRNNRITVIRRDIRFQTIDADDQGHLEIS